MRLLNNVQKVLITYGSIENIIIIIIVSPLPEIESFLPEDLPVLSWPVVEAKKRSQ